MCVLFVRNNGDAATCHFDAILVLVLHNALHNRCPFGLGTCFAVIHWHHWFRNAKQQLVCFTCSHLAANVASHVTKLTTASAVCFVGPSCACGLVLPPIALLTMSVAVAHAPAGALERGIFSTTCSTHIDVWHPGMQTPSTAQQL